MSEDRDGFVVLRLQEVSIVTTTTIPVQRSVKFSSLMFVSDSLSAPCPPSSIDVRLSLSPNHPLSHQPRRPPPRAVRGGARLAAGATGWTVPDDPVAMPAGDCDGTVIDVLRGRRPVHFEQRLRGEIPSRQQPSNFLGHFDIYSGTINMSFFSSAWSG